MVFPQGPAAQASTKQQLIIINKKINRLAFYEDGKLIKTYVVATGRTQSLTPEGTFYIREKITNRPYYTLGIPGGDPRNPLGNRWMGLSKSENGTYPYAIHGNSNESSIGKYISGGCVRMHNWEVRELYSKVRVKTKVVITTSSKSFQQLAAPYFKNIDVKAPAVPTVNPVSDKSKEVTGKTEKGAYVTVKIGSWKAPAKRADAKGYFKVTIPRQKAGKKISVTAADASKNVSKAKTVTVLDKTAPSVSTVNPVSDKSTAVSGKTEAGAAVTVAIGSWKSKVKLADAKGKFTVTIPKQKAGTKLNVTAKDKAGNVSAAKSLVVLDKTAPAAPKVNPVVDGATEVTGNAEANSTITIKVVNTVVGTVKTDKNGTFKVTFQEALTAGTKLSVTATDAAKNISAATPVEVKPAVN